MADSAQPAGLVPRQAAIAHLARVLRGATFAPIGAAEIAEGRDRALANKLVTTALRRHGHLNVIIEQLLERGLPKRSGLFEAALRIGLAELLFMPDAQAHSALYLAVEALKRDRRGGHHVRLLNGVLRAAQRQADRFTSLDKTLLFPNWLRKKWQKSYGQEAIEAFADALLEGAPLDLSLAGDDAGLIAQLGGQATLPGSVRLTARDRAVKDLPGYAEGRWWVQDVGATLAARVMAVAAGARVLDMCAAPGGKAAQLVRAGYAVTALDDDAARMTRLKANLKRLHYTAELVTADATSYEPLALFDAVLLDAPCSATGTFRRHPEVLWHRQADDIEERAGLQRRMVENAVKCLKPDGILVYCTCSLEVEEGEAQALWMQDAPLGVQARPVCADEIGDFGAAITPEGWVRTHPGLTVPGEAGGTLDGFFIARFVKQG